MKLLRVVGLALAMSVLSVQAASAWGLPVVIVKIVAAVGAKSGGTAAVAAGGGSSAVAAGTVATGAGIGGIFGLMVGDEVKRTAEGPACATMKPRRSWFGMVIDRPKMWRKLCPVKHRKHKSDPKPKPIKARG